MKNSNYNDFFSKMSKYQREHFAREWDILTSELNRKLKNHKEIILAYKEKERN